MPDHSGWYSDEEWSVMTRDEKDFIMDVRAYCDKHQVMPTPNQIAYEEVIMDKIAKRLARRGQRLEE